MGTAMETERVNLEMTVIARGQEAETEGGADPETGGAVVVAGVEGIERVQGDHETGRIDAPHAAAVPATAEVTAEPETGPASAGLKPDSGHHPAEEEGLEVAAQFRQSGIRVM